MFRVLVVCVYVVCVWLKSEIRTLPVTLVARFKSAVVGSRKKIVVVLLRVAYCVVLRITYYVLRTVYCITRDGDGDGQWPDRSQREIEIYIETTKQQHTQRQRQRPGCPVPRAKQYFLLQAIRKAISNGGIYGVVASAAAAAAFVSLSIKYCTSTTWFAFSFVVPCCHRLRNSFAHGSVSSCLASRSLGSRLGPRVCRLANGSVGLFAEYSYSPCCCFILVFIFLVRDAQSKRVRW